MDTSDLIFFPPIFWRRKLSKNCSEGFELLYFSAKSVEQTFDNPKDLRELVKSVGSMFLIFSTERDLLRETSSVKYGGGNRNF